MTNVLAKIEHAGIKINLNTLDEIRNEYEHELTTIDKRLKQITNDVMGDYFAFPTGSDAFVNFSVVMPEQWDGGTLKAKFYWKSSNTDTGDVQWKIASVAHADSGALDTAFGTAVAVGTDDVGLGTDNDLHITAATAAMTVAGTPAEGELVIFQIMRDVSGDNYNADAHLMGVLIQYRETATASAAW